MQAAKSIFNKHSNHLLFTYFRVADRRVRDRRAELEEETAESVAFTIDLPNVTPPQNT